MSRDASASLERVSSHVAQRRLRIAVGYVALNVGARAVPASLASVAPPDRAFMFQTPRGTADLVNDNGSSQIGELATRQAPWVGQSGRK